MSHVTDPTTHRAVKQHRCTWCWQHIVPGEEYRRYRFFDGGDAGTVKLHLECFGAMQQEAAEWGPDFEWTPGQERPAKEAQP
jgi:hypothetical protein